MSAKPKQEKPGRNGRAFYSRRSKQKIRAAADKRTATILLHGSRDELRSQAFERLEGLLGEIGVHRRDLLRFRHESLKGGFREIGLGFDGLVDRLHAGQLLGK